MHYCELHHVQVVYIKLAAKTVQPVPGAAETVQLNPKPLPSEVVKASQLALDRIITDNFTSHMHDHM